jgi:hypothetical protein
MADINTALAGSRDAIASTSRPSSLLQPWGWTRLRHGCCRRASRMAATDGRSPGPLPT